MFRTLLSVVLLASAVTAQAALRVIPPDAAVAVMTVRGDGSVMLGSKVFALSPTAQIRDENNRIVLPSHLSGPHKVRVLMSPGGQLQRAWILTAEEAARPAPKF